MLSSILSLTLMASAASGETTGGIEKPQEIVYGASVEETKSRLEKSLRSDERSNLRSTQGSPGQNLAQSNRLFWI